MCCGHRVMPPSSDHSPSSHSTSSSGRRIISRIASPFTSKSRNITDFSIELDDQYKQYSPGDVVQGSVRLRVHRPVRVTHIVVCLHGFVQVYKTPGSPGEGFRANSAYLGTGRGAMSGEYFGNGFASLFEDEIVLCGEGRLAEGTYQFNFELEFPDRDLPSSIDFERGTISYMITATMTRPTTISPIMTCDHKVYFVERIDISPLYPPRPRTITLEPLSRRSRAKHQARKFVDPSDKKACKTESARQGGDVPRQSETSSSHCTRANGETPISPVPSEISFGSAVSSQEQTTQADSQGRTSQCTSDAAGARGSTSKTSLGNKVITATIESQAGGCLRGDSIPIKVNITHTKQVKSLYGIIVTLYRQARVDMRPSIPLGPVEKGQDVKYEDFYPKSMTGLGGLSLSGAGSSHVFRKDLSQILVPLMIDPQTLEAEINTKVRVPEEAFPTISTVPGAMISFKYYVEVVLDIQGRLAGQDRSLSTMTAGVGSLNPNVNNADGSDTDRPAFTPLGSTMVDTASVRRDKSVVTCTFEVIIGTKDSERKKGKRKMMEASAQPDSNAAAQQDQQSQKGASDEVEGAYSDSGWYHDDAYYDPRWRGQDYWYHYPYDYCVPEQHYLFATDGTAESHPPPAAVPIPQMPDESQMTEKERIQQAETRLLPSQPPKMDDGDSSELAGVATAPYLVEEGAGISSQDGQAVAHTYPPMASSSSACLTNNRLDGVQRQRPPPAAPDYQTVVAGDSAQSALKMNDDKQELQRQELEAQASAPPADHDDGDDDDGRPSTMNAPSAPTLADTDGSLDQDIHDSHADAPGSSELPQYER